MSNMRRQIVALAALAVMTAGCQQGDEANQAAGETAAGNVSAADLPDSTISETLSGSSDHSSLAAAVKGAGLEATLSGSQPYTLFAPTNAAFEKLPEGSVEGLMQPDQKGQLTSIVTYHVVPGVVLARDLASAIERGGGQTELATVSGGTLTAAMDGDAIVISDGSSQARVTQADMLQSNGVVHSIDAVLMPVVAAPAAGQ